MSKLKTIFWFMKRPKFYPQIFQILKRSKNRVKEKTRSEATIWCKQNCISQSEALKIITGQPQIIPLDVLYADIIEKAKENERKPPMKMGGSGATSLIYHLIKHNRSENIIETGVAYGWSSLAILLAIKDIPKAQLISNDMPYVNANNEDFVGVVVPNNLRIQWDLQRLPDVTGIPLALKKFNQSLDFVHYDSDKSYTGRAWATPILWSALRDNGILMMDDINDNIYFKEFCEHKKLDPIVIEHNGKYAGILSKKFN